MAITQVSVGPRKRFTRPPRGTTGGEAGQSPDEFDTWLDQTLRDLFARDPEKTLPPELKALIEPKPRPRKERPRVKRD